MAGKLSSIEVGGVSHSFGRLPLGKTPTQSFVQSVSKDGNIIRLGQSCEMSILLHRAKPSNQILPKEKRVNRNNFGTKIDKGVTFGEQMLIILLNYESLDRHFTFTIVCSLKLLP